METGQVSEAMLELGQRHRASRAGGDSGEFWRHGEAPQLLPGDVAASSQAGSRVEGAAASTPPFRAAILHPLRLSVISPLPRPHPSPAAATAGPCARCSATPLPSIARAPGPAAAPRGTQTLGGSSAPAPQFRALHFERRRHRARGTAAACPHREAAQTAAPQLSWLQEQLLTRRWHPPARLGGVPAREVPRGRLGEGGQGAGGHSRRAEKGHRRRRGDARETQGYDIHQIQPG